MFGGCYALRANFEAVMQKRFSEPATADDSGALVAQLVPSIAGPQDDEPAANGEPLPPARPRRERRDSLPEGDVLRGFRDYTQGEAEASGRFFEPNDV
jgi:hypothetical protein